MIRTLVSRLFSSRIVQRLAHVGREVAFYWVTVEKGNIGFAMLLSIPVMMLVGSTIVGSAPRCIIRFLFICNPVFTHSGTAPVRCHARSARVWKR